MGKVWIVEDDFGTVKQPDTLETVSVRRFTFSNENGVRVQVITYGSIINSFVVPDGRGQFDDIVLGFDNIQGYLSKENPYFGATVGRVCNRIADGTFSLNGNHYVLAKNIGENHLHGGHIGFNRFNWSAEIQPGNQKVTMTHVNKDGFEGYPGSVVATVTYELTPDNCFKITFHATTDKATPINLTNHSYFNLAGHDQGHRELYNHVVQIYANKITETNDDSIPTGALVNVAGTAYDFQDRKLLGTSMSDVHGIGFDDNYCVTNHSKGVLQLVAKVEHPKSGRTLLVRSDQPGVQLYTSNYMPDPENSIYPADKIDRLSEASNSASGIVGKDKALYFKHGAFCLETQKYPDAVNQHNFPNVIVNPGEKYEHAVEYKLLVQST